MPRPATAAARRTQRSSRVALAVTFDLLFDASHWKPVSGNQQEFVTSDSVTTFSKM